MIMETAIFASASASASGFQLLVPALPDLLWGTVAFVIVAIAIYKFAWPTFSQLLEERGEKIDAGLQAAAAAQEEIAAAQAQLRKEVTSAQQEAASIREKAQENARMIIADAQMKGRDDAADIVDSAQQRIVADQEAASRTLQAHIGLLATDLAGRIIGEAVSDKELAGRVIDRFLDELEQDSIRQKANSREA